MSDICSECRRRTYNTIEKAREYLIKLNHRRGSRKLKANFTKELEKAPMHCYLCKLWIVELKR